MIVIVGAGLAGLSTAYHLRDGNYCIYEKEGEVGGLCRSFTQDGFTFDYTGHLLHLKEDYTKTLFKKLLPQKLKTHVRRASVYSKGIFTPYPFQANMYGLPKDVIEECITGFIEAKEGREPSQCSNKGNQHAANRSFKDWIIHTFGSGIAKHFMVPYNEKMWKTDLCKLSSEWVDWSIPVPTLDEMIGGARGLNNQHMGYSARFLYPEEGGIEAIPKAFLPYVGNLHFHTSLTRIDPKEKRAWFDDGSSVAYDVLVSTIPLPELLDKVTGLSATLADWKDGLKHISVLDVNLGIDDDASSDQHWVYFPEPEIPFYRVGFYSNFSSGVTPPKKSALYAEVSYLPDDPLRESDMLECIYRGLETCGLIKSRNRIVVEHVLNIPYAYVLHDDFRHRNLSKIMTSLNEHHIFSIGRYGSWAYMSMEDALLMGKEIAEVIDG